MTAPAPEACLVHARTAKYKGGTLIAEDVRDVPTHLRRLADPDVDLGHGAPSSARGEREPTSGAKEERPRGRLQLADKLTAGEQRQVLEDVRGELVVPQNAAQ